MGFFPFQPQTLPLSGGTITGPLTVTGLLTTSAGITNSGGNIQGGALQTLQVGNLQASLGTVDIQTAGKGLAVAEGSNAKQGTTGAMTAGAITVANTNVTASSRIVVCRSAGGTNPGAWYVSAQTAGVSFVATSTNAADTGNGVFEIFEPG